MKILVIGGGPAGSSVARFLADTFDVTIIQDKIWEKPCGGGVKTKVFKQFDIPQNLIEKEIDYVNVIFKNRKIKIDLKGKNLSIVNRKEFDNTLRDLAVKSGVKIIYGKFKGFKNSKALIKKESIEEMEFDILIAADGVNSTVRKALNLPPIPKILTHYAKAKKPQNNCDFYFDRELAGNYYALDFPYKNISHIGCVKGSFESLAKYLNVDVKAKGYFIPSWQEDIIIQKDNIFFVGDSAGEVMPLTFEGIYYAITSANILANSIKNGLDYKSEWNRVYLKKFKFMKKMEALNKNFLRNLLVNSLQLKTIQNFAINLWLGEKG